MYSTPAHSAQIIRQVSHSILCSHEILYTVQLGKEIQDRHEIQLPSDTVQSSHMIQTNHVGPLPCDIDLSVFTHFFSYQRFCTTIKKNTKGTMCEILNYWL